MDSLIAFILVVIGVAGFCARNSFVNGVLPLGEYDWVYRSINKPHYRMLVVAIPNILISFMIASAFRYNTAIAFATAECAGVISLIALSCLMKGIVPNWQIIFSGGIILIGTYWLTTLLQKT